MSVELERKVVEDLLGGFFWVTKGDIFELDDSFEVSRSDWIGTIFYFGNAINDLKDSSGCLTAFGDFLERRSGLADVEAKHHESKKNREDFS